AAQFRFVWRQRHARRAARRTRTRAVDRSADVRRSSRRMRARSRRRRDCDLSPRRLRRRRTDRTLRWRRTSRSRALMSSPMRVPAAAPIADSAPPLWRRYRDVRSRTQALADPLSPEDCALQSMPDASPVKWHLAHTTWFFETFVVAPQRPSYRLFDPAFRVLFNSYYNGIGEQHPRPERGLLSRPSLDDVLAYRAHVDAAMRDCCDAARTDAGLAAVIELGLAHEEQHQEL